MHAYVPECDPIVNEEFHERGDHGHLLKVLTISADSIYLMIHLLWI